MSNPIASVTGFSGRVSFQTIGQSFQHLPDILRTVPDVLRNPASNPLQAVIMFAILFLFGVIVLLTIVLTVMKPAEEVPPWMLGGDYEGDADDEHDGEPPAAPVAAPRPRGPWWRPVVTAGAVLVLLFAVLWLSTAVSTANNDACTSCHTDSPHNGTTADRDVHKGIACVSCHESGGPVARATIDLLPRVIHIANGRSTSATAAPDGAPTVASPSSVVAGAYGLPVASDACSTCHATAITATYRNPGNGLIVSHKEPIAAGAECVDCHISTSGLISGKTVGMRACLRCHDGKAASAACSTCHAGDPARAIAVVSTTGYAERRILTPNCGSCHKDQSSCDSCHGLRMPHSAGFMQYGHALAGARAIWNNNGAPCSKCHYPGHRDCTQCHAKFPQHGPAWKAGHAMASWSGSAQGCSCHRWNQTATGINFCQICHTVKPPGAKP